jgi:predicted nucleic acid-binding Zn ribbon protein
MAEPGPSVCEICGEGPVEKVLYPAAIHFKGSGFYSTDYGRGRKGASKDGEGGSSGEKSDSGEKKETTKDSKDSGSGDKKTAAAD